MFHELYSTLKSSIASRILTPTGEPRTTAAKLFPGLPTQDLDCNANISCPKLHGYTEQQFSQT
jgi:hypothetical protein